MDEKVGSKISSIHYHSMTWISLSVIARIPDMLPEVIEIEATLYQHWYIGDIMVLGGVCILICNIS